MSQARTAVVTAAAIGSVVLLAVPWRPAFAQAAANAASNTTAAAGASPGGALQEVVITAERRATNIQTTPISVVAVSGAQLASQNIVKIKNLQLTVPSVTIDSDGLYQSFNIRGIGNQAITPDITTGVAVLVDGLFSPETHGLDEPFYDIADTEVLRGPQGTFVGYSSTGGALEITTQNPNFRGFNGYTEVKVENYTGTRIDGATNVVIAPNVLAVRLAYNWEKRHSFFRDNGARVIPGEAQPIQDPGSVDDKDARLSVLWQASKNFNALLKLDYNTSDDGGDVSQVNQTPFTVPAGTACPFGSPTLPGPNGGSTCFSANYLYGSHNPWILNWGPQVYLLPQLGHPYYNYRLGLHLHYYLPDGIEIRSLSGFQQTQYDTYGTNNSIPQTVNFSDPSIPGGILTNTMYSEGAGYQWIPKDDYWSEELDLISPTTGPFWSKFNWIAGGTVFYRDTGVTVTAINTVVPYSLARPFYLGLNNDILNRIYGIFGQISWQFAPTLQLQVGARENWDNNATRATVDEIALPFNTVPPLAKIPLTVPNIGCTNAPYMTGAGFLPYQTGYFCVPQSDANQRSDFKDTVPTGKIDLNWTPLPGQFFYAFFARGYKAGGALAGSAPPYSQFQPEHVNDWELGWNGQLLNDHMQTHLGGYYMDYQAMQQVIYNIYNGSNNAIANIGSSQLEGIEASVNARLGGFGTNFNVGYEHSALAPITEVASYELPPQAANRGQCGLAGVTTAACFDYAPYQVNLSGEQDIFAPEITGSVAFDYLFLVGQGSLDPRIQFAYTSHQYASLFQIPLYYMGPRHIWNASLTYDVGQWDLEAYINNMFNETYLDGNNGGTVFYGAPEQFGVRARYDFH